MPEQLHDVPDGGELWRVDDQHLYVKYTLPGHDVPLLFHVNDQQQLDRILGGQDPSADRELTTEQANEAGAITFGDVEGLTPDGDPFNSFVEQYREEAEIRPSLRNEEVLGITLGAALEGREPTDAELMRTDYWKNRSAEQRDWEEFAAQDPASAQKRRESNRLQVRNQFVEAGYDEPPESLVNYYADRFTTGEMSDVELQDAIQRETDPYAPGASPFAGQRLGEDERVVSAGDRSFVESGGQRFELTGPGQQARFGGQAEEMAPEADFYSDGHNWFLQDAAGRWFRANGEGQVEEARRIYGEPKEINRHTVGDIQGNFLDLTGGRLEQFDSSGRFPAPEGTLYTTDEGMFLRTSRDGSWFRADGEGQVREARRLYGDPVRVDNEDVGPLQGNFLDAMGGQALEQFDQPGFAGTAKELFADRQPGELPLGQEEEVRETLHSYLGPKLAQGYGDEWVNRWAGKLRNEGGGTQEELQQTLQGQFDAMFPQHAGQNLTYEDIAGPFRSIWEEAWGQQPDETDELWMDVLRTNDFTEAERILRREGIERGNETVRDRLLQDSLSAFGQRRA